jgi:hypothetical protein
VSDTKAGVDTPDPSTSPATSPPRSNRIALIAILIGFLAVLAAMIGALFLDTSEEPIGDARAAVEAACGNARSALRALGSVDGDVTNVDLADRIRTETELLRNMVAAFDAAETGNTAGQRALDAWAADWSALLDARDAAAAETARGIRRQAWLPPEAPGKAKAIDGRMDEYARREAIGACTTTALEADNLYGQRFYNISD